MIIVGLALGTFAVAYVATGLWRRNAINKSLLDLPNSRSSHTCPTPRGGGVAIWIAFSIAVVVLGAINRITLRQALALVCAGGIVAWVGLLDDHRSVSIQLRLLSHIAASVVAVALIGGAPPLIVFGHSFQLGIAGDILSAVYLVWLLNLYNFMDGINGIASMEALTVCLSAALLLSVRNPAVTIWPAPFQLGVVCLGFLLWNFPKPKIFMGDVGSGFLGFVIGLLSLISASVAPEFLWIWMILLGVFIVDATVTLVRRLFSRERIYEAHRSHAYQRAADKIGTHQPVTWSVAIINLGWLLPLAFAVEMQWLQGAVGMLIAYAPLVWIAIRLKAGVSDPRLA